MGETQTCAVHENNKTKHNKTRSTELIEDRDEGDLRGCWESIHVLGELEGHKGTQKSMQTTQIPRNAQLSEGKDLYHRITVR
jgi:hypothetical protein